MQEEEMKSNRTVVGHADSVEGKIVLVTGGSRGLGEAISRNLATAGATVIVGDIRSELADKVVEAICSEGGQAFALAIDVTDEAQVEQAVHSIVEDHGHLDVLVNNAGTDVTLPVDELSVAEWDKVMAVNLRGPFLLSKFAFGEMKRAGAGAIVNIVSTAAKRAWPNASVYHASKWGLLGLSHALHAEGRQHNIKVTAVIAGGMRTAFLLDRFPDIDVNNLQDPKNVANAVRFVLQQPLETVVPEITVLPMRETSWP
jgi:NAD(P)-dependent dehydrogenase (short-subunit alcohol dehydrogenase family)